jgi:hypothetical protein
MMVLVRSCFVVGLLALLSACQAAPVRPPPAMATDIPDSIITPERLDTSIGRLNFRQGFPDEATAERIYDNLDFMHGVQAFLTSIPGASMLAMREAIRSFGPENETVLVFETLMDSKALFLTANTESVYCMMWLNTKDGPMVIETPPNVLGIIDDAWFHYVADFGRAGPDKGEGGKFLILPPDHEGEVPDGYHVARSRTYGHWVIWRGFLVDGDPAPAVAATKSGFKVYPLDGSNGRPTTKFVNVSGKSLNTIHAMDFGFFEEVNRVIQDEPNEALDPETLGLLASIGIVKGQPFAPDGRMKRILIDAAAVASATARTLAFRSRDPEGFFYPDSAWCTPFIGGSHEFLRNGARLLDARSYFFFYATGITPAMSLKMVGVGSQYALAFVDSEGRGLDGAHNYSLHLPAGIPAEDFWSIVVYDNQTRSQLQTDARFPSVGNQQSGLQVNADESVDIYFGPDAPEGLEGNWVQTLPGQGWNTILRLYGPLAPWFEKTWQPGEIVRLD